MAEAGVRAKDRKGKVDMFAAADILQTYLKRRAGSGRGEV
jgi:RNase H-fold protein (predicted Holliday junction resolvase)